MKYLSYILSFASMVGCYFNIVKNPICWPIWELTAFGFGWYFLKKKDYGSAAIWIFYILFDAYGWWSWTR